MLKQAIAYEGTDAGFTQVVAAMAKAGLLDRRIKGKRTYRIASSGNATSNGATAATARGVMAVASNGAMTENGTLDYDELAAALLARVARAASAPAEGADSTSWARRRLEQLEARNTTLQRDIARANAETESVVAERDALRDQLEAAQHNLELLTDRLKEPQRQHGRAADRLGPDEQTLLHQLRHRREPTRSRSPERAS
ncbi:MAG: hypothetical protein ABSG81_08930 [Acidimicrobiales bacterium]